MFESGIKYLPWLLAMFHAACTTSVTAIDDNDSCEDGALAEDGSPILLGDECYDDWATDLAEFRAMATERARPIIDPCVQLAEAIGETDTWSAIDAPIAKALAACKAASAFDLPAEVSCRLDGECGGATVACEATTPTAPPLWLTDLETTVTAAFDFCCDAEEVAKLINSNLFPTCRLDGPGLEDCVLRLYDDSGVGQFTELVNTTCTGIALRIPLNN